MEIVILQENLKKGISAVQNIIGKNLTLPILNNILLSTENNLLKLTSTDLEIAISYWVPCKIQKKGQITIPTRLFSNFINNLPVKKIELKTKTNNVIQIKCENFKSNIKGLDAKEFPIIPKIKTNLKTKIECEKLIQGLNQVINFTSLSNIRPEISGVFINFNSKKIKVVATDSFRLGEKVINLTNKETDQVKNSIIIPLKTAQELIRVLSDKNKDELIEIFIEKNQVLFKTKELELISRLIEGNYPNYEQLITDQFETTLILDRIEFLNAIKISSLFSSKINDVKLKVFPKKSLVEILAQDIEVGENISTLKGDIKGKEIEVIFNYKYLIDGLNSIETKKIIFGLNGEINPGIIKPVGDQSFIYVIMPIKL